MLEKLPNALSLFRLFMVPVLGVLAWQGRSSVFLAVLICSLASDLLDGWLARRAGIASELGAKLDSWGDLATYSTLPLFAWWLWPDVMRAESAYLVACLVAYTLPIGVGFLRFRRLTSYHTWAAKGTAVVMGVGVLLLLSGGPAWPFHVAVWMLAVEAAEEIAITLVLPGRRTDVPTLWHVLREREA